MKIAGYAVFHPKYGFGTVHSLRRRDQAHPVYEPSVGDANADRTEDYYDIHLKHAAESPWLQIARHPETDASEQLMRLDGYGSGMVRGFQDSGFAS